MGVNRTPCSFVAQEEKLRGTKNFFGIKLNLSQLNLKPLHLINFANVFEIEKLELVLFRLRLVWVNLGEVIRV